MLVKKNIYLEENKEFLNYIIKKCDIISLTKYQDQHNEENSRVINIILSTYKYQEEDILSVDLINNSDKIYNEFKDNKEIFNKDYKNKYENDLSYSYLFEDNRKSTIIGSIYRYIYNYMTDKFINKFKDIIIKKEKILLNSGLHHSTIYYFKLIDDMKQEIIEKKSIFDWCYPYSMEDISFFSNGYCWLYSIAHENLCEIYCESEEEYEYLKSVGIEFVDECYIPISKDDLYYEKY